MSFTRFHSPIRYDYLVNGTSLSFSGGHVVDLAGVTFDRTLSFNFCSVCSMTVKHNIT